jgi:transcriptional regulator with GAF, ATPase, and Fis domain
MLILDQARSRFKKALDRRFSRDKSQLDRTLQQMSQAVQQLVDPPALAQRLLQATTELMGVTRGSVFLRQGDPPIYRLQGSLGPTPSLEELASGCPLIEALKEGNIVNVRHRSIPGQTPAQRQLQLLGGEIAHPLAHEGRLLALLVLGSKDSPYRADDFNLLAAFAQITVLALESAEGHRTIEGLNLELQSKLEKISEQQRRILALQSQLSRQTRPADDSKEDCAKTGETAASSPPSGIVGSSPMLQELLSMVRKVATTQAAVLIRGESGTGKELLARAVHENSLRAGKPFVKVHCAALSANLLESELFGHVKGSFTGAHRDKMGRFELASGGTLFLDEIGDINLDVQTKLLRVLQEKVLERVGSSEPVQVDVRIITATHQNLENLIRLGKFREDLYYRLNVFPIEVPPLRNRVEDIAELATLFMRQSAQRCQKELAHIDDDALVLLKAHSWPGNIRQLENVIERAVVICDKPYLSVDELPAEIVHNLEIHEGTPTAAGRPTEIQQRFLPRRAERDQLEREQLVRALAAAAGNKAEAARAMGVARSTLVSRLKKLGLS